MLVSLLCSAAALADTPRLDDALSQAHATDAQRDEVHRVVEAARPEAATLRDEALDLRERFKALFLADTLDVGAIETVRQEAVSWFDDASALAVRTWVAAAQSLDAEQRATLQSQRHERIERLRARFASR